MKPQARFEASVFFFEKKNQKTFGLRPRVFPKAQALEQKFLRSFFSKSNRFLNTLGLVLRRLEGSYLAAIHLDIATGDEAGARRTEESHLFSDFFRPAQPGQRAAGNNAVQCQRRFVLGTAHRRIDDPG